ncbi:uncharacterized protein LOC101854749 [Aplysia californica]|uniref:Uncharacterized protein LOC101854749 n=1 Tax=Aplysia californica TaxID=6500 RepID=A0ABM0K376_APLCA|nr:uncharacterized protein LOC101854749 [Aplysia californica]
MLPRIHLGALLTATNSELASQSREQGQATREARVTKNMEGFYVYQTYLRRLRRMHRSYVAKYRKAHPSAKQRTFGPPPRTTEFYTAREDPSQSYVPLPRHRLSLSDTYIQLHSQSPDGSIDLAPPPPPSPSLETSQLEDAPPLSVSPAPAGAIYIPCGRENSFKGRPVAMSRKPKYLDPLKGNSSAVQYTGRDSRVVKEGAMPFSLWRRERGRAGAGTVYSLSTVKEEQLTSDSKLGNFPKLLHRNINAVSNN